MKIGELRSAIKTHNKEQLETLVAELYKLVPKDKKEDYDIDSWIKNPPVKGKKKPEKTKKVRPINDIAQEVEFFSSNAYAQNYLAPNQSIPKKDRPKWRFVVKRLYKEIQTALDAGNNPIACLDELEKLYQVLTYACHWQIFSAYDPFESVGIAQREFFDKIVTLYRNHTDLEEFINKSIKLIIDNPLNRYTLYTELIGIFIEKCNTSDLLNMSIEQTGVIRKEVLKEPDDENTRMSFFGNKDGMSFMKQTKLNNLTEIGFTAKVALFDYDAAIQYFQEHHIQRDEEVKLYILIKLLFNNKLKDQIVKVIEGNQHLKPRKALTDLLQHIKKTGKLPNYL